MERDNKDSCGLNQLFPSNPSNGVVSKMYGQRKMLLMSFLPQGICTYPRDERTKFDSRTKQCIFLGYNHEEFGYRCWDLIDKKVIRNGDVVFLEDQFVGILDLSNKNNTNFLKIELLRSKY